MQAGLPRVDWISKMYFRPPASTRRRTPLRPRPTEPLPDWSKLSRGDRVHITRRDGASVIGRIDMLALDRSVFWIFQDDGRGRLMVCSADKPLVTVLADGKN
jgi:hypothetical protein